MRTYLVKPVKSANPDGTIKPQYAGSQSEASQVKKAIQEANGLKRTEVGVEEVDVPTSKAELIAWLNKNAV